MLAYEGSICRPTRGRKKRFISCFTLVTLLFLFYASDDYHLTACLSLMKFFVAKYGRRYIDTVVPQSNAHRLSVFGDSSSLLSGSCKSTSAVIAEVLNSSVPESDSDSGSTLENVSRRPSVDENTTENTNHNSNIDINSQETAEPTPENDNTAKYYATKSSAAKTKRLSVKTLEVAIDCCQKYINDIEHGDLDAHDQVILRTYHFTYYN